ncbi:class I SAM-dependent methyltransferase [Frigoribacterium sp. 2-23]|uniref:class I SAM-dependent methyltransferase n=1 Tax=Frigoribacterium sp. 2-23 TaxID=3415006 RepID=UPI003C703159
MTSAESFVGRPYWEDRYAGPDLVWSGNPNPVLVDETVSLTPGRALDIGSGEGGDALWLARQGWQVTGVDIAQNALDKARGRIESIDAEAASRITWEQHDITEWTPEPSSVDLVSSQFMHLPEPARTALFRALAAALRPGGTLLIVAHDLSGVDTTVFPDRPQGLDYGVDDVLASLDGTGLEIVTAEVRPRPAAAHTAPADEHGHGDAHGDAAAPPHHLADIVVRATRPEARVG